MRLHVTSTHPRFDRRELMADATRKLHVTQLSTSFET